MDTLQKALPGTCLGYPLQDGPIYSSADAAAIFLTDVQFTTSGQSIHAIRMYLNTMSGTITDFKVQVYRPDTNNNKVFTLLAEAVVPAQNNYQGEYVVNLPQGNHISVSPGDRLAILNPNAYVPLPYSFGGQVFAHIYSTPPSVNDQITVQSFPYPFSFAVEACLVQDAPETTTQDAQSTAGLKATSQTDRPATVTGPALTGPPTTAATTTASRTTGKATTAAPTTVEASTDNRGISTLPWCREQPTTENVVSLCQTIAHGCSQNCVDVSGSYHCTCAEGFELDPSDNKTCKEIPLCEVNNGFCQHGCGNSSGVLKCSCLAGYSLSDDAHSCLDMDECLSNSTCASGLMCVNIPGSHVCLPSLESYCAGKVGFSTQNSLGLISEPTFIGFIAWLALLTVVTIALLIAITIQSRGNRSRRFSYSTGPTFCYDGPYNPKEEERADRERIARLMEMKYPVLYGTSHVRSGSSL